MEANILDSMDIPDLENMELDKPGMDEAIRQSLADTIPPEILAGMNCQCIKCLEGALDAALMDTGTWSDES